jgi:hypothetical protein
MFIPGLGPWYVALLFNENDDFAHKHKGSKRKSDVCLHTYVHKVADTRNLLNDNDNWVTIQIIGPFMNLDDARSITIAWKHKVRSKAAKIQRGFDLLSKYHKDYNLKMWCRSVKRDVSKRCKNKIDYRDEDIQTIRDMQKRRRMK